jgi:hypothetical protein
MKSIKTNPNSAKEPDKGNIFKQIVLHILELSWLYFFLEKNRHEKRKYKKLWCNSIVKIWFGRKKILNYAYVLKNGVDQYNIFFKFLHKACWILLLVSFSYRIHQCFVQFHDSICAMCFLRQQTISHMPSRMNSLSGHMNIARVNIEFFMG